MIKYECGEVCGSHGCNQAVSCPVRAQHYTPAKPQSTVEFISKFAIGSALVVTLAYLFAECMV